MEVDVKNSLNFSVMLSGFVGVFPLTSEEEGLFLFLFLLEYMML